MVSFPGKRVVRIPSMLSNSVSVLTPHTLVSSILSPSLCVSVIRGLRWANDSGVSTVNQLYLDQKANGAALTLAGVCAANP